MLLFVKSTCCSIHVRYFRGMQYKRYVTDYFVKLYDTNKSSIGISPKYAFLKFSFKVLLPKIIKRGSLNRSCTETLFLFFIWVKIINILEHFNWLEDCNYKYERMIFLWCNCIFYSYLNAKMLVNGYNAES